jgi:hypothetical protein
MTEIDQDSGFLRTLHDRLALIAAGAPAPDGPEAQALLSLWPASSPSLRLEPATLPACDYLAGALELGMVVDVAIERWEMITGQEAQKTSADGQ